MGLFGDDANPGTARRLADNAAGSTVTADRLTKTKSGMMQANLLEGDPVITYLDEDEQPHFFFWNDNKGITRDGATIGGDSGYRNLCVVTDSRILYFANGSQGEVLPFQAITDVEGKSGVMKHRLTVRTSDYDYTFFVSNSVDGDEVEACGKYIRDRREYLDEAESNTELPGLSQLWDDQLHGVSVADEALDASPQGAYVTKRRYEKVKGILDPGEKVHFITRGSTVDTEGSGAGESLFGDDRSRKTGTRGWVRAVITDKRVAIKIPQMLGTDERSVPYSSLTSVDLDTGLIKKRLTLQTPGQTYHIEADDPGKDEVRQAIQFIRKKLDEANQPDVIQQEPDNSEPDPLEQIEKLKELHDSGAISEEEFETKKQDLLDQI